MVTVEPVERLHLLVFFIIQKIMMLSSLSTSQTTSDLTRPEDDKSYTSHSPDGGVCALFQFLWSCCSKPQSMPVADIGAEASMDSAFSTNISSFTHTTGSSFTSDIELTATATTHTSHHPDRDISPDYYYYCSQSHPDTRLLCDLLTAHFGGTATDTTIGQSTENSVFKLTAPESSRAAMLSRIKSLARELYQIQPCDDVQLSVCPSNILSTLSGFGIRNESVLCFGHIMVTPVVTSVFADASSSPIVAASPFVLPPIHISADGTFSPSLHVRRTSDLFSPSRSTASFPDTKAVNGMTADPLLVTVALKEDASSLVAREVLRDVYGLHADVVDECLSFCRLLYRCELKCADDADRDVSCFVCLHIEDAL